MNRIATAGNTLVPAYLVLEQLGFSVEATDERVIARRGDEEYTCDDPLAVLGLIKLVEVRSWNWRAPDPEIDRVLKQYQA